jgi:hypothetical protein
MGSHLHFADPQGIRGGLGVEDRGDLTPVDRAGSGVNFGDKGSDRIAVA